jgi:hyaluronate lyase
MFDDEIVALGSGINCSDNVSVETIIENRKLKPDNSNTLTVVGQVISPSVSPLVLPHPTWAHLSGNAAKSDIGYYFPQNSDVQLERGERSGNWRSINTSPLQSLDRVLKANYLTLYVDHGINPKDATYSYVILPNKSAEQVKNYANTPDVIILENSAAAHGVYEKNLRITGVNFWNDATTTVGSVTSDRKSSVMMKETDTAIFFSVSEPTQRGGVITLQIERSALSCLRQDKNINIVQFSPTISFTVDTADKKGMPSCISFKK